MKLTMSMENSDTDTDNPFERSETYTKKNIRELRKKYGDHVWIAVENDTVLFHSSSYEDIENFVNTFLKEQHTRCIYVKYLGDIVPPISQLQ